MSKNKRTWNDKIKLALNELESKISDENKGKAEVRQEIIMRVIMSVAFLLATAALIRGVVRVLPGAATVSNTVNGRELPIYCVETDKKQVALSFDAAWGNDDTAKILEILKKHNIKVTFFMTGGWVVG